MDVSTPSKCAQLFVFSNDIDIGGCITQNYNRKQKSIYINVSRHQI
jgi:hypothetical protein